MKNKKGNIAVIAVIIAIVAITAGVVGWMFAKKSQAPTSQVATVQPIVPVAQTQPEIPTTTQITLVQKNSLDWSLVQFDACGKQAKYEKMQWWNKFAAKVGGFKYYTDNYIESQITTVNTNDYYNPTGIKFTKDTLCSDLNKEGSVVCGEGKDKKLSISDFNDYGEGCLAKDGTAFVAVFPGEYMGGGNYIFRYDINNDILEFANKVNELRDGNTWFAPPTSFGKRVGNIIKMTGSGGDAGCGSNNEFNYDIVANQVKLIKTCFQCEGEKLKCSIL